MSIVHVQTPAGGASNASATSITLAFAGNVTAGNCIAVGWRYSGGGRTVTLSDTLGNTYTSNAVEAIDTADSNSTNGIGFALNIGGGACTVTFAVSGGAVNMRFSVSEFSGVATSSALDKTATAIGSSAAPASGAVTPTTNGQLLFVCSHISAISTFTAGTDFTIATTVPTTPVTQRLATEYYVQPTAASHDGNFSLIGPLSWGCAMVTLKEPGGGASAFPDHYYRQMRQRQGRRMWERHGSLWVPGRSDVPLLKKAA